MEREFLSVASFPDHCLLVPFQEMQKSLLAFSFLFCYLYAGSCAVCARREEPVMPYKPHREKTGLLSMREQRRISAVQ